MAWREKSCLCEHACVNMCVYMHMSLCVYGSVLQVYMWLCVHMCLCICAFVCMSKHGCVHIPTKNKNRCIYLIRRAINHLWSRVLSAYILNGSTNILWTLYKIFFPYGLPHLRGSLLLRVQTLCLVFMVPDYLLSLPFPPTSTHQSNEWFTLPAHTMPLWHCLYSIPCIGYFL